MIWRKTARIDSTAFRTAGVEEGNCFDTPSKSDSMPRIFWMTIRIPASPDCSWPEDEFGSESEGFASGDPARVDGEAPGLELPPGLVSGEGRGELEMAGDILTGCLLGYGFDSIQHLCSG